MLRYLVSQVHVSVVTKVYLLVEAEKHLLNRVNSKCFTAEDSSDGLFLRPTQESFSLGPEV